MTRNIQPHGHSHETLLQETFMAHEQPNVTRLTRSLQQLRSPSTPQPQRRAPWLSDHPATQTAPTHRPMPPSALVPRRRSHSRRSPAPSLHAANLACACGHPSPSSNSDGERHARTPHPPQMHGHAIGLQPTVCAPPCRSSSSVRSGAGRWRGQWKWRGLTTDLLRMASQGSWTPNNHPVLDTAEVPAVQGRAIGWPVSPPCAGPPPLALTNKDLASQTHVETQRPQLACACRPPKSGGLRVTRPRPAGPIWPH